MFQLPFKKTMRVATKYMRDVEFPLELSFECLKNILVEKFTAPLTFYMFKECSSGVKTPFLVT
jgi:hypothetical protein